MVDKQHVGSKLDEEGVGTGSGDESSAVSRPRDTTFAGCRPRLSLETLETVRNMGFEHMTPVQAATIPLFLTNKDLCVEAVTGSGKTLAFVVPVVEMILRRTTDLKGNQIGAIIIAPTRELANQIFGVVSKFAEQVDEVKALLLVGGTSIKDSITTFKETGARILVGTPGRLLDLLSNYSVFDTRELEALVLDEADRLLDEGFSDALNSIFSLLPKQRRTGLFSATQTRETKDLARAGLRNPATVRVAVRSSANLGLGSDGNSSQATPTSLENYYMVCPQEEKLAQLVAFLVGKRGEKTIVFFMTCAQVDFFTKVMCKLQAIKEAGIMVEGAHGKMDQTKRDAVFKRFRDSQDGGVLTCTDLGARGLDIPIVEWTVQFDPPKDPSYFVHRVGRAGRGGRKGRSLSLLAPKEDAYIHFLSNRQVPLMEMEPHSGLDAPKLLEEVKDLVKKDRDLLVKGTAAFISFIRAYKLHQCQFIFRFKDLNLGLVARSFALLKLPKMAELSDPRETEQFERERNLDISTIKYTDKFREKARQKKITRQQEENKQAEEEQAKKLAQGETHAKPPQGAGASNVEDHGKRKRKGRHQQLLEEWDELAKEERLHRKLRRKKITVEEYERECRGEGRKEDGESEDDSEENTKPCVSDQSTGAAGKSTAKWKGKTGLSAAAPGRGGGKGRGRGRGRGRDWIPLKGGRGRGGGRAGDRGKGTSRNRGISK